MTTSYLKLKGKFKWSKVYEPDEYSGDQRFITQFYPEDDVEWAKFDKSGLQLMKKVDIDGEKYVSLRRPVKKMFPSDEEVTRFRPPIITGAVNVTYVDENNDDAVVHSYKKSDNVKFKIVGEQIPLGNDTKGVANIAVYDTLKGKGHRLESIHVNDLVVYDPDNKTTAVAKTETTKVVEEKKAVKTEAVKKTVHEDMSDQIPW